MIWNVSVGMRVNIDYDDIEADSKEEAEAIAKERAQEDIDYNNCNADTSGIIVYVAYSEDQDNDWDDSEY